MAKKKDKPNPARQRKSLMSFTQIKKFSAAKNSRISRK